MLAAFAENQEGRLFAVHLALAAFEENLGGTLHAVPLVLATFAENLGGKSGQWSLHLPHLQRAQCIFLNTLGAGLNNT